MIVITLVLILLSFLQATLLPYQLVLLFIISRSFTVEDDLNYYLAFGFGILLVLLLGQPLGYLSIIFIVVVKLVYLLRMTVLASRWFYILPLSLVLLLLVTLVDSLIFDRSINFGLILGQVVWTIPIYLFVKFWEERFVPRKDIKLKLGH